MSVKKIAVLLAAGGLAVGLIGGGVGAVFQDQVTATENIAVGTFGCGITDATGIGTATTSFGGLSDGYYHSVSYTAPTITSSAAGNAPFSFTVMNYGSIPDTLTVSAGGPYGSLSGKFSAMAAAPAGPVNLAGGASQVFNAGIQWTVLDGTDLGDSGSVTWTVNCGEQPATHTVRSAALNYGPTGWAGWSCDHGQVVSASITDNTYPIGPVILWKPGATAGAYTYPTTPFGYTYGAGEEGAIAQNGGTGQTVHIDLVCTGL